MYGPPTTRIIRGCKDAIVAATNVVPTVGRLPDEQDSTVELATDQRPMQRQRPVPDRIGTLGDRGQE